MDCSKRPKKRRIKIPPPSVNETPVKTPEEAYNEGLDYFNEYSYYNALKLFEYAAKRGLAEAQYRAGLCYLEGKGVKEDSLLAGRYFTGAAEQGHAGAQNHLGDIKCREGEFRKGRQEYAEAINLYVEAVKWYTKAAEQGHAEAQCNLGICYDYGQGVREDEVKALEWYTKAAEQGNAVAQVCVGLCHNFGDGVPQDEVKAAEWYTKAAEQGNAVAQYRLGLLYSTGKGVPQDDAKAAELFMKSADRGCADAQYFLGNSYAHGIGVPEDYAKSVEWYTAAAHNGHQEAKKALKALLEG